MAMSHMAPIPTPFRRLVSLDILRGVSIAFMIMVNDPEDRPVWAQMQHANWNGIRIHVCGQIPNPGWAEFSYSFVYMAICFVPVWILYRKKIFLKV